MMVMFLAACGGSVQGQPSTSGPTGSPRSSGDLIDGVDPCKLLSADQLQKAGLGGQGKPVDGALETGCEYSNQDFAARVYKNKTKNLAEYEKAQHAFDEFEPNQVNGHPGARVVARGSKGNGGCTQVLDLGKGSVAVEIGYNYGKYQGKDPCADAMAIAKLVEPNLPK
ncbi:Protein of unknown function (DUF3558) [Streptoalloteichus tenebrarius]|uniref:DUF3558 domain-containing protein n=2 Tax=Streptoalloteichus tenebrarius (strain ATCC 17920 / DSM 40477 / JCM 4838 / CBS 697.72 / NBRC 16177 / NCIMB 11028 / NRRL B-12390 / A12253. 1 / ISP 5477) TaxID=1933 RepID=A0ABT1HU85_STRSD|nr:Protein of unknown function (DUF3558) [Streptoalloteichus tenebrarius]